MVTEFTEIVSPSHKICIETVLDPIARRGNGYNYQWLSFWHFNGNLFTMITNYLRAALRSITRHKLYSGLNILGLAIGMAVALTIGLWAYYQYSYDRFLPGYADCYQVRYKIDIGGDIQTINATSLPLAKALTHDLPEISWAVHTGYPSSHALVAGKNQVYPSGLAAGSDFLQLFKYPLQEGSADNSLADPYSIVLSAATAKSLFGNEHALGRTVRIDNEHDLRVTAVMADIPDNATIQFSFIVPLAYKVNESAGRWSYNAFQTFVALRPGTTLSTIAPRLKAILRKYSPDEYNAVKAEVFLQGMKDWHLYTEFKNGVASGGMIDYVRLFIIIGVLVLAIACINFMNLCTARAERRAKEVGIRKAIGGRRVQLIFQFLTESILLVLIAFFIGLLLTQLCLPAFSQLTGCPLALPFGDAFFWLAMFGYVLFTGVVAGARPAFFLSGFRPVKVLKGWTASWRGHSLPGKILVIAQFSCAIALISSTVVVYEQIGHAKDRSAGYAIDRLMTTDMGTSLKTNYPALRNDLLRSGLVVAVSRADGATTTISNWWSVDDWPGKLADDNLTMATIAVDGSYFQTLGMSLAAGHGFTDADSASVILNESAVRRLKLTSPINHYVLMNGRQWKFRVVGVVKDALMISPFAPAEPTFFINRPAFTNTMIYRLAPGVNIHDAVQKLGPIFRHYDPAQPFTWHFADERYAAKFAVETLIGRLAALFAALAIFISCLGIFGLATYMADTRRKEIGIRKVLGASVPQLWALLSRDFVVMTAISALVATPLAWYFLHSWLQQYAYRITINPLVFLLAGGAALAVTLLTVSFRSVKAALANPARSLRSE
jgi:putative ABC transport system permease protein